MKTEPRIILITGAGAGIGAALTRECLQRGAVVYAGVRNMSRAESDFADLKDTPGLRIIELDVNDPAHGERAIDTITGEQGRLDVLVNNAGYGFYGVFEELSEAGMRAQMETNFFAALRLMRLVLPAMRERGAGTIINVTSILGRVVIPTGSAYTSSKFALEAATEAVRYEAAPFGVWVTAVEPGLIHTNFKKNMEFSDGVGQSNSPYGFLNRQITREYKRLGTSADACARIIARIIEKRRPKARYLIGLDAKLAAFARWLLPGSLLDFIIRMRVRSMRRQASAGK